MALIAVDLSDEILTNRDVMLKTPAPRQFFNKFAELVIKDDRDGDRGCSVSTRGNGNSIAVLLIIWVPYLFTLLIRTGGTNDDTVEQSSK